MRTNCRSLAFALLTLWALSVASSGLGQTVQTRTVSNDDVVKMVAAGLSEEVVLAFVRQAPPNSFDTSPTALIALKEKQVPQSVIAAMISGATTPAVPVAPSRFGPPAANADDPLAAHTPGFYVDKGDRQLPRLQPLRMARITNTRAAGGGLHAVTGGLFGSVNLNYRVSGESAAVRVSPTTSFYYYDPYGTNDADAIVIVRLTKKGREREFTGARKGDISGLRTVESDVELVVEKAAAGVFRLQPKKPLTPGEYGFAISLGAAGVVTVYDFGVD